MDYCRIDYENGCYEYLKNDTMGSSGMRADALLHKSYRCIRMRRLKELPPEKECNKLYFTEKYKQNHK